MYSGVEQTNGDQWRRSGTRERRTGEGNGETRGERPCLAAADREWAGGRGAAATARRNESNRCARIRSCSKQGAPGRRDTENRGESERLKQNDAQCTEGDEGEGGRGEEGGEGRQESTERFNVSKQTTPNGEQPPGRTGTGERGGRGQGQRERGERNRESEREREGAKQISESRERRTEARAAIQTKRGAGGERGGLAYEEGNDRRRGKYVK